VVVVDFKRALVKREPGYLQEASIAGLTAPWRDDTAE
jgi:hypothetical protein